MPDPIPPRFAEGLTLLLPARADEERDAVAAAWSARGGAVLRLERFWEPPPLRAHAVRLYGPEGFALVLAQKLGLELVSPPDAWLTTLDRSWLGRPVERAVLGAVLEGAFPLFVKPLVPKAFAARVYPNPAVLRRVTEGIDPRDEVLVSPPVRFGCEVRVFMREGRVVAAGLYEGTPPPGGAVQAVAGAAAAAGRLAGAVKLPRTLVVDLGWLEGAGFVVVEANATWGSGLNGCDPVGAAWCLEAACRVRA